MTLREAMQARDRAEFERLLGLETDLDQCDEQGWTALGWAAGLGEVAFIEALVQRGADVFKRGRDNRTPYLIALAAGHRDALTLLRAAEQARGGDVERSSSRQEELRPYCRAYPIERLRGFAAWSEPEPVLAAGEIVFLHRDGSVTRGALHGHDVLWASDSADWHAYCAGELGFRPPSDLDLLASA
jgi:ankyrin repeat protein